jgi:phosphatidylserine/phosphatidylglycerophosphate/cardiolipin synthase-like enzyme
MSRTLIVLPDDSAQPLLDAINGAKSTLRVKMFVFSDISLLDAVIAAHRRGVKARVMLNPERRDGQKENGEIREKLVAAGVDVQDSNPCFDVTHEKSMVIDDETAFIESLNWEPRNLTETRDYAVVTKHKHEVEEVMRGFDADWNRTDFVSSDESHLIWCIGNGRQRMCEFIDKAKHTLWLQNERYQDPVVIEHLVHAHTRGVKIHVMARPPHKLKKEKLVEGVSGLRILEDLGVPIHKLKHIKLHGKVMLADDKRAIVGSINIAPGSFDSRRELAIEVDDDHIIHRIRKTLEHDWGNSRPLDLSDEGLLEELKDYDPDVVEDLGISPTHKK